MMTSHASNHRMAAPSGNDDLQRIDGIGQGIARRLHSAGVLTFAQLAEQSPEQLAKLVGNVGGLSAERIIREHWIEQARDLAVQQESLQQDQSAKIIEAAMLFDDTDIAAIRQHNATFTTRFVLNEKNEIQYTRIVHFESQVEEAWAGWQSARLVDFFVTQARLQLPGSEAEDPGAAVETTLLETSARESAPTDHKVVEAGVPSPSTNSLTGTVRLRDLEASPAESNQVCGSLRYDQPFVVRLTIDLADVKAAQGLPLEYVAVVYAKRLDGHLRKVVGEARATIRPAEHAVVTISGTALPPGIYRIEATVSIATPAAAHVPQPGLMAMLEGGLLQIY